MNRKLENETKKTNRAKMLEANKIAMYRFVEELKPEDEYHFFSIRVPDVGQKPKLELCGSVAIDTLDFVLNHSKKTLLEAIEKGKKDN